MSLKIIDLTCPKCGTSVIQNRCQSCREKTHEYTCQKCGCYVPNPEYRPVDE
ncbi:MAG: zinc finger domain-containing protein [Nitrososphaerota archaeon]|nr:zinc finger domain-containing protein [Nitrososphaerota archaeon]